MSSGPATMTVTVARRSDGASPRTTIDDRETLDMTNYDRRDFLRRAGLLGAGVVATTAMGPVRPAAAQDDELAPFLHGVASGDPTADSVILWTRVTLDGAAAEIPLRWEIATDLGFADIVDSGTVDALAVNDHTVKVRAAGLAPFTYHYYRFFHGDTCSLIGRTKTAPGAGQEIDSLRFGLVSCANYEGGYFNGYARLAERDDMDAILCAGDYVYEYGQGQYGPGEEIGRVTQPAEEMVSLDQYRGRYSHYRLDPDLRRIHQLYPWITTWDDHETTDNSWSGGAVNHQADEGDWEERKRVAWKAYREWLPIATAADDPDEPIVLYRTLAYGDLADVVVLDTRIDGRDEPLWAFPGVPPLDGVPESQRLLSETQESWFHDQLASSTARWRIVLQQIMVMQWQLAGTPDIPLDVEAIVPDGLDLSFVTDEIERVTQLNGTLVPLNGDAWDGYPHDRSRLFELLRGDDITDVVVLTGDIHTTWAAELHDDPYGLTYDSLGLGLPPTTRNVGVEFVTPSITSDNFDEILGEAGAPAEVNEALVLLEAGITTLNPHIKSVDLSSHGYSIVTVTPDDTTFETYFTPILEPSSDETFHKAWTVDRSAGGPDLTSASAGHRLRASGPTEGRGDVAEAPGATPVCTVAAGAPIDVGPAATVPDPQPTVVPSLPATGGTSALALGALAATGAIVARRVRRAADGQDTMPAGDGPSGASASPE